MSDMQIPMSGGTAQPVDSNIPMKADYSLPLKVKPFGNIDQVKNAQEAYNLASTAGEYEDAQSKRLDAQADRESAQRDKMVIDHYTASGGDLYSPEGVDAAEKELKGKLSAKGMMGLGEYGDKKRDQELKMKVHLNELSQDNLKLYMSQTEQLSQTLSNPLAVYDKVMAETKDSAKATEAFEAAKQASLTEAAQLGDPKTGPTFPPQVINAFSKFTPEQAKNQLASTARSQKILHETLENKLTQARTDALEEKADSPTSAIGKINADLKAGNITQEQADAAIKKANHVSGEGGPVLDDESVDRIAENFLIKGREAIPSNLGRGVQGSQNIAAIEKSITKHQKDAGYSNEQVAANQARWSATKNELNTIARLQGNLESAVIEADKFADLALEASKKVPRGDFVPLNQLERLVETKTSTSAQSVFLAANTSFINAYATAVGRGKPTVDGAKHAREMIDTSMADGTYEAVIRQLQKETAAAKASPEQAMDDVETRITKNAKNKPASAGRENFPKVTKEEQASMDSDRKTILSNELTETKAKLAKLPADAAPEDKHRLETDIAALEREVANASKSLAASKKPTVSNW